MKTPLGFLVLTILQCIWVSSAAAQIFSQCDAQIIRFVDDDFTIPNGVCQTGPVVGEGPFSNVCFAPAFTCAPIAAKQETCPDGCGVAGKPISLATGNTFIKETDVRIPGLAGGLTLVRTWNSLWPSTQTAFQVGLFGPNWRSTFEERMFVGADSYVKYARGDGSFWSFGLSQGLTMGVAAPANVSATLVYGTTNWTLTFQNGEQRIFDTASGHLNQIIDRNGNITQLTYDGIGRLTTVTDPASRHLYFSYPDGSSFLVSSITSDVGISLAYAYDAQSRLSQVTNPDLSTYTFQYNGQSLISSVTDQNGKILESHTYDSSGRGLTSSRANGVEALSISYNH